MNKKMISIIAIVSLVVLAFAGYGYYKSLGNDKDMMMENSEMTEDKNMNDEDMMDQSNMDSQITDGDKDMLEDENTSKDNMMDESMQDETMKDENMTDSVMLTNDGEMAYDFELMSTSGESVKLSDLKGQKIYVKFWASWCSICLAGLEEVDMLSGEDNGFKVITIVSPSYNGEMGRDKFIEWFDSLNTENMTVLLDDKGTVAKEFGVRGYPTSVFIGSDGVLIKSVPGHIDNESVKTMIDTFN